MGPTYFLLKKINSIIFLKADLIITNLSNVKKYISPISKEKKKIQYIPNPQFINKKINISKNLNHFKNFKKNFTIIYVGSFNKAQNVQLLIKSLNLLKKKINFKLILIGDGTEKQECLNLIKKFKINNVKIINHIPRKKVLPYIHKSHLCIATTISDETYKYGISLNKFTDYMGCARPIIVTTRGHNNPVLLSKCGLTSNSFSSKILSKKIEQIYNLSDLQIAKMGFRGYKYSHNNFNYSKLSEKYYSLLKYKAKKI